jgi:hypothetical protein
MRVWCGPEPLRLPGRVDFAWGREGQGPLASPSRGRWAATKERKAGALAEGGDSAASLGMEAEGRNRFFAGSVHDSPAVPLARDANHPNHALTVFILPL